MRNLTKLMGAAGCAVLLGLAATARAADAKAWKTYCDDAVTSANERRFTEANQFMSMALGVAEQFGEVDPRLVETLLLAARVQEVDKHYDEAEPHLRRALALRMARLGTNHLSVADCAIRLGKNLSEQRKFADAEPFLKRAEHICKWKNGAYDISVGTCQAALARNAFLAGRYGEADKLYTAALKILGTQNTITTFAGPNEILDSVYVPNYRRVMQIRIEQAQSLHAGGKYKDAEDAFKKLVKLIEDREGKESGLLVNPLLAFGSHYADLKKYAAAEGLLLRRQQLLTKYLGEKHLEHLRTVLVLERVYRAQDKRVEADLLARQLAEAGMKPAPAK